MPAEVKGTLLMLDDVTPHVAVVVQVVVPACGAEGRPTVLATTLSDEHGRYQFVDLPPGQVQVRCYTTEGYIYWRNGNRLRLECGQPIENVDFRLAPFKKGMWRTYTPLDGLVHNSVGCIGSTFDGGMWFGTDGSSGGISYFDGERFVSIGEREGLSNNSVWAFCCGAGGSLWLGTWGGVSRYDGETFVNFTEADGLAHNLVFAAYPDPTMGGVWFGTYCGVSHYDGKGFTTFTQKDGLAHDWVRAIHRDSEGVLWFATEGGGVSRYDGEQFVTLSVEDGLADNHVFAIASEPDGTLWFGTWGGVSRYDGKTFVNFTEKDGLPDSRVNTIYRDADGILWFGTGYRYAGGGGVSRYDGKGFVNFTVTDGLPSPAVSAIYRAPDTTMWFGTDHGISRYDEKTLTNLTSRDGLPNGDIRSIFRADDGTLWLGTCGGGIVRYEGKRCTTLTQADGLISNDVWAIERDVDGALWFGTSEGISRYDGKTFVNFTETDGLVNNTVITIYPDPDGTMWFGTLGGVSRYDGNGFVNVTMRDGLAHSWVPAIYRDQNNLLWFGTHSGCSRYDGKKFVTLGSKDGLANDRIKAIYRASDGALWFATDGGVSRYDGNRFLNFTEADGLAHNAVTTIYQTSDGRLWFGTFGGGVSQYDGTAWASLDTRDGLAGNTVWAITETSDGSLWFATDGGLTQYRRDTTPPLVRVDSVKSFEEQTNLQNLPPVAVGNRVTISYRTIDFNTVPEKRQYQCRIRQTDAAWGTPTKENRFDWIPEEPGRYTFQVRAIDRHLNYSDPATVNLTVQPDPKILSLLTEVDHLRREVGSKYHFGNLIGRSAAIKQVRALTAKAIDSGLPVLITGKTGTGKELVAKAIHYHSPRGGKVRIDVNCGALPQELVASTLFGHRKGAFTGANEDRAGLFESASGGTVVLDEIGEMPMEAQPHLLRVLEERKVQRIGEFRQREVDVRVIAITNVDLAEAVAADRFRRDLYYRLNRFHIHVPALRERTDDIPILAEHFLQQACREQEKTVDGFAPQVFDMLQSYPWPGNIRELENEIHQAVALVEDGLTIQTYHFSPEITGGESLIQELLSERGGMRELVESLQRRLIEEALRACDGNRSAAARQLKIDRSNLRAMMKRLGIDA